MSSPHDHKINFKYINKNIQNNTLFPVFVLFLKSLHDCNKSITIITSKRAFDNFNCY